MTSKEITAFIEARNGELCVDEILQVLDPRNVPQIDHVVCQNGRWEMWDKEGNYFTFTKRNW